MTNKRAGIEYRRWPVALGDAYTLPLHLDPDFMAVSPSRDELARSFERSRSEAGLKPGTEGSHRSRLLYLVVSGAKYKPVHFK